MKELTCSPIQRLISPHDNTEELNRHVKVPFVSRRTPRIDNSGFKDHSWSIFDDKPLMVNDAFDKYSNPSINRMISFLELIVAICKYWISGNRYINPSMI